MNGSCPRNRSMVARLRWSGAVVLLVVGIVSAQSAVVETPETPDPSPRQRLEKLYAQVFEISSELARVEDPEEVQALRVELRRLMVEVRDTEREMQEQGVLPDTPQAPRAPDMAELLQQLEQNVDWEEVNRQINERIEGLGGTLSQLGEILNKAQVEVDEEGLQFRDGQGSQFKFRVTDEMKENLAEGFKELQEVWADDEARQTVQESLRRLGSEDGPAIALGHLLRKRESRERTVKKGSIFRFGEDVEIADDLIVDGDVFVFGADAYVVGEVRGNVIVIVGDLFVENEGRVHNAISAGGRITLDDRNAVHGNMFDLGQVIPGFLLNTGGGGLGVIGYGIWLAVLGVLLFFGYAIAGQRVDRIAEYSQANAGRALLGGALWFSVALGAFIVATLGLVLTIIGIPVAMILGLAFLLAMLLSYFATCEVLGTRLFKLLGGSRPAATWSAALLGLALLEMPGILSAGLGPIEGFSQAGMALRGLDIAIKFVAIAIGFGAMLATRGGGQVDMPTVSAAPEPL